jgi:hypothetical protein
VQHHALDGLALLPAFVSFAPLLEIEIFELGVVRRIDVEEDGALVNLRPVNRPGAIM